MTYKERNHNLVLLHDVMIKLDKLQVELCEDSPYDVPDAKSTRARILSTFDSLEQLSEFITNLNCEE